MEQKDRIEAIRFRIKMEFEKYKNTDIDWTQVAAQKIDRTLFPQPIITNDGCLNCGSTHIKVNHEGRILDCQNCYNWCTFHIDNIEFWKNKP